MKEFIQFIKSQEIVGLAIAFIFSNQISNVVSSLVTNILNPIIGIFLGKTSNLNTAYILLGGAKVMWGSFVSTLIDFLIIAFVVYFLIKNLKLKKDI